MTDEVKAGSQARPAHATPLALDEQTRRRKELMALRAATLGFFVDMYDVYLPVITLALAITYFTPPTLSATAKSTLLYTVFAASLIGRPLGSLIFGPLGDRIGRRKTTIISAAGFTVCTGLIAILPGYDAWGIVPAVLLVLLRLIDGMFLGGEYSAANPLAMEYAPRTRRGLYGSIINTGYPAALAVITIVTILTLRVFPSGNATSSYAVWGWRVPFVIGFVISFLVLLYYLHSVPESELWVKADKNERPLADLFSGTHLRSLMQVFVVMTGAWLTLDAVAGTVPGVLKTTLSVSASWTNIVVLVGALVGVVCFPITGVIGQRYGRRHTLIVLGILNITLTPVLYAIAVASGHQSLVALVLLLGVVQVLTLVVWSIVTAYITESFPTSVRASGYGIGYSLASIVPAFYSYYMLGLGRLMPYEYTQVVILVLGGVCLVVGAYIGPDNRHRELG